MTTTHKPIKTVGQLRTILAQCNDDQPIEAFYSQYDGSEDVIEYVPFDVYLAQDDTLRITPNYAIWERENAGSVRINP